MSAIGVTEPFHRLEEFSSVPSCITFFGRPIIPPLLTPSLRLELQQIRAAAVAKEADILKRKKDIKLQENVSDVSSKNYPYSDIQTSMNMSCALWYPSGNDSHEGVSVAISKLPTSGIYSSVHTGAIVCSNVIENSHRYASKISRDSSFNHETSSLDCMACSHSNINLNCHLCQAEYDQNFHNSSFGSEISPEVPCRTFSLLQQNTNQIEDELNSTMDETECESLPTIICSQKHSVPDTDSESNITCMTQSTDLEKYMEVSCEFSSPDNSASVWDSRSISQQYTLSRSDDASSETVVNTENELTPCASTLAEFTDNIEDELSIADDTTNLTVSKGPTLGTLKRSHSVDSYMKIIQTYAKNMHVKKSSSEPLNTNYKQSSSISDDFVSSSSKISHLIKEDSKESEESKEIPEKDINFEENNKDLSSHEEISLSKVDKNVSHLKRHVRQNSYTLDEPSFALIQAHGDCSCSLDINCTSPPHCSALNSNEDDDMANSAFMKEKVAIDIPVSVKEKYPVLSSNTISEASTKGDLMPSQVDVFPVVKEITCEKNNAENLSTAEDVLESENLSAVESRRGLKVDEHIQCYQKLPSNCGSTANQEYFKHIFHELQEQHELRMRELREEQNQQWLKLQDELKEQEMRFYEKVKQSITSSSGVESEAENLNLNEVDLDHINAVPDINASCIEDCAFKSNTSETCSEESISFNKRDSSFTNVHKSDNLPQNSSSLSFSSVCHNHLEGARALITPSNECETSNNIPFIPSNISDTRDIQGPVAFNECNGNLYSCASNSLHNINGFPSESAVLLPQCDRQNFNNSMVSSDVNFVSPPCFCEKCSKKCNHCISYNGYSKYESNLDYASSFNPELNHPQTSTLVANVPNKDFNNVHFSSGDNLNFSNIRDRRSCVNNSSYSHQNVERISSDNNSSFSKKVVTTDASSQKSKDSSFTKNSKSVSSPDILNSQRCNKIPSQQPSKDKTILPINSTVSQCVKGLKSGSVPSLDTCTNNQIDITSTILHRFEKLPAFVKGYLTRRLYKTEHVQNLIKTLQDTILLLEKLNDDLSMKGKVVSERDVDFHRQLIVQLMTTFHKVYDIFCTISTKERMNIIAESRNLRLKQKLLEQESAIPVATNASVSVPSNKPKVSAATEKRRDKKRFTVDSSSSVDSTTYTVEDFRRARSVVENRTYTVEDLKDHTGRPRSQTLSKSHSTPSSTINKVNVGEYPKRKTSSCKTSNARRHENRWLP